MLRRIVYIERGAIVGACAIAPLLAALAQFGRDQIPQVQQLLAPLIYLAPALALIGAVIGLLVHRSHASGHVRWGGPEETTTLLKQGVAELVSGQTDSRLNDAAMAQANAQEGRVAAIYLLSRMAQMRQAQVLKQAWPNPISWSKRAAWSFNLLLVSACALLVPAAMASGVSWIVFIIPGLLLLPIWVTGVLICGFGLSNADSWLRKLPGRDYQPKLKPRGTRTTAGSWHTKESRQDLPIIRGLMIVLLVLAGALYLLREYTGDFFTADQDLYAEQDYTPAPEPPDAARTQPRADTSAAAARAPKPRAPAPEPTPDGSGSRSAMMIRTCASAAAWKSGPNCHHKALFCRSMPTPWPLPAGIFRKSARPSTRPSNVWMKCIWCICAIIPAHRAASPCSSTFSPGAAFQIFKPLPASSTIRISFLP